MPKDSLTGESYEFPKGVTYIKIDGTVLHFANSKNRKNYFMKRRKLRWVSKMGKTKSVAEDIKAEVASEAEHAAEMKEAETKSTKKK